MTSAGAPRIRKATRTHPPVPSTVPQLSLAIRCSRTPSRVSQRVGASLRRFLVKWGLSQGRSEARRLVWSGSKLNRTESWRNEGHSPSQGGLQGVLRTTRMWTSIPRPSPATINAAIPAARCGPAHRLSDRPKGRARRFRTQAAHACAAIPSAAPFARNDPSATTATPTG